VLTPFEVIPNGAVLTSGRSIVAVGPDPLPTVPSGTTVIDFDDATILPGFVDVHIHGSGGATAMDGADAVEKVGCFLPIHGTTSWLPTLTARSTIVETAEVIRACVAGAERATVGAEAVGIHLEGPFLNAKRPGALRCEWFRTPSLSDLDALLSAARGWVRLMTIAPELPGGLDVVRALTASGVTPSIGHSDATAPETVAAVDAGVRHATHLFNAMRGMHHRDPGIVGAVLVADQVRAELIADGIHVLPLAMSAVIRAKGPSRVAVITDAVSAAGLGDGDYEFDGRPISVREGKATLGDGTIAGSVGTADDNYRRIVRECGVSSRAAAWMTSFGPAQSVGISDRKGSLTGGRDADVIVLDPELRLRFTMARGEIVFQAD
jgi:N-acetylglucosamine-6-phosphate deacetylase